jgi:hypothetical protein
MPSNIRSAASPSFLVTHTQSKRMAVWSASARAWATHPMAGVGPGLLCRSIGDYYRSDDADGWRPRIENAHNYFLQLAAETGLFGLLGFVWVMIAVLFPPLVDRSSQGHHSRILVIGALGFLATLITGNALLLSRQATLFWGFLGVLCAGYPLAKESRLARRAAWLALPLFLAAAWADPAPYDCHQESPSPTVVGAEFGIGFHQQEGKGESIRRWMLDAGEVHICNRTNGPLVTDVSFAVQSFDEDRNLAVYAGDRLLADLPVGSTGGHVTLRGVPLEGESTALRFVASPGARRVDDLLHNGDRRSVSILFVGTPTFSPSTP